MAVPLWRWSATDLAKAIRKKRLSSQEAVEAHLERIRAVNPSVNAVTVVLEDQARHLAAEADARLAAGDEVGPLHGVPITIKENLDLAGSATTHGVVALASSMPPRDAPLVAHMKRAGAVPIGRTNMPDFGLRWHTSNDLRGPTLNPWDPSRTPGGSSGGEAAAIATGMSPLGIGNDLGGSLRYPSQCCGITAIRPSRGRVSTTATTISPESPTFYGQVGAVNGPMARHVKDLRLGLEVMSQRDPSDPFWTPAPNLGSEMAGPIRVAMTVDPLGIGTSANVAGAIRRAADVLASAGYAVEEVDPPSVPESAQIIKQTSDVEIHSALAALTPMISAEARTVLEWIVADTTPDLPTYMKAIARRHGIAREWSLFMERYPLVLGPVSALEPVAVGYDLAGPDQLHHFIRSLALAELCNLLGLPSVATPIQVAEGLPQGVQIIGPRFHENLCLDAAEVLERKLGVLTPIEPQAIRAAA